MSLLSGCRLNEMFSSSTQRKAWIFASEKELANLRCEANRRFIAQHGQDTSQEAKSNFFLTALEERMFCKQYELFLKDFCKRFQPAMPRSVVGTSFNYFKRFYLHNSVMDYHPKEILVTCVYLACKVEEFNVSITQFVANIKGNREKAMDIILNNELLLMQQLSYHLTIHNPFRPIEGLIIDIKTRYPSMKDPQCLRPAIDDFLDRCLFTDACLLYAPSQVALTAIIYAAGKFQENINDYVTEVMIGAEGKDHLPKIIEAVKKIRNLVKNHEGAPRDIIQNIEKKLEKCRNQENNPDSQIYKRKMQEMLNAEEDRSARKYAQIAEEQRRVMEELVGTTQLS